MVATVVEKRVAGAKTAALKGVDGLNVNVVDLAEARRALRRGVARYSRTCRGTKDQKTLGLGDRAQARRWFKMRTRAWAVFTDVKNSASLRTKNCSKIKVI